MARTTKPLINTEVQQAKPKDKEFNLVDGDVPTSFATCLSDQLYGGSNLICACSLRSVDISFPGIMTLSPRVVRR